MGRDNGDPLNSLKPQPGQYDTYHHQNHPLPGPWAQEQMSGSRSKSSRGDTQITSTTTEISRALAAERATHEYWQKWQGIQAGKPVYEDPRAFQNTLLPVAKYGTDGRGD